MIIHPIRQNRRTQAAAVGLAAAIGLVTLTGAAGRAPQRSADDQELRTVRVTPCAPTPSWERELRRKLEMPISELDLSVRAANCMEVEGFETLADICSRTEEDLLQIRNFGKTSLKEITKKLTERGLSLGMDVPTTMWGLERLKSLMEQVQAKGSERSSAS